MTLDTGGTPDLELDNITKSFGDVAAVDGVSLTVPHGRFYSLLGPSGCGKTTTLRIVAGFERPDSGRVVISGTDATDTPPNRRRVNTVFQHYALFPHMSVEDNVAYGLRQEGLSRSEITERLNEGLVTVRLEDLRGRYPRELSGGQQQRVALARALVKQPTVLLLDEPLAALDLKLRKAMQIELKRLQERVGITFVYVTHDQEEALTLSDRIAIMNNGRILQEGTPEEVYERPTSMFVADFIGQTNLFEGTVEATGDAVIVREKRGFTIRCAAHESAREQMKVHVAVRPERIEVHDRHTPSTVVEGVVTRRTYLGDLLELGIGVADLEIIVQRQNLASGQIAADVGQTVFLSWSEQSALVLTDDTDQIADLEARRLVDSRR